MPSNVTFVKTARLARASYWRGDSRFITRQSANTSSRFIGGAGLQRLGRQPGARRREKAHQDLSEIEAIKKQRGLKDRKAIETVLRNRGVLNVDIAKKTENMKRKLSLARRNAASLSLRSAQFPSDSSPNKTLDIERRSFPRRSFTVYPGATKVEDDILTTGSDRQAARRDVGRRSLP
jgi:hypothetical protein